MQALSHDYVCSAEIRSNKSEEAFRVPREWCRKGNCSEACWRIGRYGLVQYRGHLEVDNGYKIFCACVREKMAKGFFSVSVNHANLWYFAHISINVCRNKMKLFQKITMKKYGHRMFPLLCNYDPNFWTECNIDSISLWFYLNKCSIMNPICLNMCAIYIFSSYVSTILVLLFTLNTFFVILYIVIIPVLCIIVLSSYNLLIYYKQNYFYCDVLSKISVSLGFFFKNIRSIKYKLKYNDSVLGQILKI